MKTRIHVIDDEPVIQDVLTRLLKSEGYEVETSSTEEEALRKHDGNNFHLVLLDLMIPGSDGVKILREILKKEPEQIVIIMTAYASVESAIATLKLGAYDYIQKPFKNDELLHIIKQGLEKRRLKEENIKLKEALYKKYRFQNIIGKSPAIQKVFDLIKLVAPTKSTILIHGESGTGKELVAKAIHQLSPRAKYPFVAVNSGSMPPDLIESNLFGHVKGSFTGAIADKKGLFEVANNGTIFFDEIGTLNLETQAKILRVIQEKEFMRLGGTEVIKVDVRIIAATNIDLKRAVINRTFREDLFYRLNVIKIDLPPLRERKEDIPLLVEHFIKKYSEENQKVIEGIEQDTLEVLMSYWWPGNVRELEHCIERAVVLTSSRKIRVEDLAESIVNPSPLDQLKIEQIELPYFDEDRVNKYINSNDSFLSGESTNFKEHIENYKRELLLKALREANGVKRKAAKMLGLKASTFHEMLRKYKIAV
ncbi:MAG: sigma-54-dependent transcriptional regulator [Candidatus Aminicenantia bacterium]